MLLAACRADPELLLQQAGRVSMALRGTRPSEAELDALGEGRVDLETLAGRWVLEPAFGQTVRNLHAEQLLVRWDTEAHPPPRGALADVPRGAIGRSLDEEPLRLVERVVTEGRPYTDVLTADTTMADRTVAAAYGLDWQEGGPEWQELPWPDGRPAAGILSSTGLWQRHMASDTNHHRARAKLVIETLLCQSLDADGRGVRFPSVSADAVRDDPACASCHARLDPVASAFFGFRRYVLPSEIRDAYATDCAQAGDCYPLSFWDPDAVADRAAAGMPDPAWDGRPVGDLEGLARTLAEDPAFADCTARRFASWLGQRDAVPPDEVAALADAFVESGFDARSLAVDAVLQPAFLEGPPLLVRPEQYARLLEDLTGFRWSALPGGDWGPVDLGTSDAYGMRALMGGIDGWHSIRPSHGPSPTKELAWQWAAAEAAAHLVSTGRFDGVDDPGEVRDRLRHLHRWWLLEPEPDLGPDLVLFDDTRARGGDLRHAWTVTLTALLLDDRLVSD